jgi:hypothetical protein
LLYLLQRHPPASDSAEKLENANWGGGLHSGDFTTCAVFLCSLLLSSEMSPHSGINLRVYCAGVADAAHVCVVMAALGWTMMIQENAVVFRTGLLLK